MRTNFVKARGLKFFAGLSAILLSAATASAQPDTIYLNNGQVVSGKVTRIAEHTIQFSYENEEAQQS